MYNKNIKHLIIALNKYKRKVNNHMYKKVLLVTFIVLLVLGNIFFYNQTQKLDYSITIGIPIMGEGTYPSMGIDFYDEPLSDRNEANLLIFSFMNAVSIDKPKVCEELPNLTVWINDWKNGISYYQVNLWLNENSIIIESDECGEEPKYKIIDGSNVTELKKVFERYKDKTYK